MIKKFVFLVRHGYFRPHECPVDGFFRAQKSMAKTNIHPVKARTMPLHRRCANRILIRDGGKWREGTLCIHIPSVGNELHVFYHPWSFDSIIFVKSENDSA